jgi:ABC-type polysaccharide/polyol phosphate export permease
MNAVLETEPSREIRYRHHLHLVKAVRELWGSRELLQTLAERDLRVRYKQTFLGAAWAVLLPLALMVVFSVFLQRAAKFDTNGVPYVLFSYIALIPWSFFSSAVTTGGQSLVQNSSLLNKVACPREVFPIATVVVASVDMFVSTAVLGFLFIITWFPPHAAAAWVPVLLLIQIAITVAVTLIVSSVLVYVRDLRQALPIVLQLGLFATPVAYGMDLIPDRFRLAYSMVNPLAPVIDGYRRTVLYGLQPDWTLVGAGVVGTSVLLCGGYALFKRLEVGFADVA